MIRAPLLALLMFSIAFVLPAGAGAASETAAPGKVEVFGDWAVGCDNRNHCEAVSLLPEDGMIGDAMPAHLVVARGGEAGDAATVELVTGYTDGDRYELTVDGRRFATEATGVGQRLVVRGEGDSLIDALARGRTATPRLLSAPGTDDEARVISLTGSAAALRYMDARQGRAGTTTALLAKGRAPFAPPLLKSATVVADRWTDSDAVPSTGDIVRLVEEGPCADARFGLVEDRVFPLGRRAQKERALVLVACGAGAYNMSAMPYLAEKIGDGAWRFRHPDFYPEPGYWPDARSGPALVNADWNADTQILSTHMKGRGIGDCGGSTSYVWDGEAFRMTEAADMPVCRGSHSWIRTWRADTAEAPETTEANRPIMH